VAAVSESPSSVLRRRGLRAKKSWGQNFLGDDAVLDRIASSLGVSSGEPVVELGAGLGHLTRALLRAGARVFAVERDPDMVQALEEVASEALRVVPADAAHVQFHQLAGADRVAVVGNLPYHLTSPILFQVLDQRAHVSRAVFTVQKEVAERLAAPAGTKAYGLLSVLLGTFFEIESLYILKAALFHPPPKVDSAVIRLTTRTRPRAELSNESRFRQVVKAGFGQRRKTLFNALRAVPALGTPAELQAALAAAGVDPQRRAETLTPEEFAAIERGLPT
jgi:16S rRNA (adenine1518-N6/adenine1519-N6)-dimethyltransferase